MSLILMASSAVERWLVLLLLSLNGNRKGSIIEVVSMTKIDSR